MADHQRKVHVVGRNALLEALPVKERERLHHQLERYKPSLKETIYDVNGPITHVYFPLQGVISLVVIMADGLIVEAATIGNEGMVGLPTFLGAETSPNRALSQISGDALRMPTEDFRNELKRSDALVDLLCRYNQALMNQMAYSVACNRLHSVEERMCRWLLMSHDRVGEDEFPLTQEFLAQMLGVRRPSVSVVAGILHNAGLISYIRGKITIRDRKALEAGSCECYQVVEDEFERLLSDREKNMESQLKYNHQKPSDITSIPAAGMLTTP